MFYRYSTSILDKPLKTSWEKKEKLRLERKLTKAYERALKDNRAKELEVRNVILFLWHTSVIVSVL